MKPLAERLAGMSLRRKLEYLWTYYKLPILGGLLLLALVTAGILRLAAPRRETLVRVVLTIPRDPGDWQTWTVRED